MNKKEIKKLAIQLWIRDNTKLFKCISKWLNLTEADLKLSGHWYIAQSKLALKDMREKRREVKWEY